MKRGTELGSRLLLWRLGGCRRQMTGALKETRKDPELRFDSPRPFQDIPQSKSNPWIKMLRIWKDNSYENLHLETEKNFEILGSIYRDKVGTVSTLNLKRPQDVEQMLKAEGPLPHRPLLEPWLMHRQIRKHKCGIFLLNGKEWLNSRKKLNQEMLSPESTAQYIPFLNSVCLDFVQYLKNRITKNVRKSSTFNICPYVFRFTMEASTYALYGERLGLMTKNPDPDGLQFIKSMNMLLTSTPVFSYTPLIVTQFINSKLWKKHLESWDYIFQYTDKCIQKIYQEMSLNRSPRYSGVMAQLLEKADLPLEAIKANITELTAGSVETTTFPLLTTLFEVSRNQDLQNSLRKESLQADACFNGDPTILTKELPLLRATIKETLRLYPVAPFIQRFLIKDTVIQNYRVPAGTLVQVLLYSLGRNAEVFEMPERYDPSRWMTPNLGQNSNFRNLFFGYGLRQCIGRRLAESEMILFLHHILKNFHVETLCKDNLSMIFRFILHPKSFPLFTFRVCN